ncbi:Phage-related minor tail protein [Urinicoccus massiliensis]|uniref:Phage-related minor tail protein n=1 Tax=Urinicoccus massiliensis TaxID=1723382 RepID=A0A8H2M8R1_9FIRM|nr:phage tail tape measure protein [Urinicoccus massiliensis]VFB17197.1 Phage-related minor tail protein [Urinicoccus massiliensis]
MSVRELAWKLSAEGAGAFADDVGRADKKVDDLKGKMEASDKMASGLFGRMQSGLQSTGGKWKAVGGSMVKGGAAMTAATMPLAIKLKQGVSDARDLDTAIRQVTTLTDENILPTAELKKTTKRISNESGIMQKEVANAMYEALSSGVKTEDVVGFTEQALKLTKAGFTDLPTVIDATTTALNAYGDKAFDVNKIQDIMVKTQDLGKITVDEMGKNMGRVIPTAAAAGFKLDQLGATYSLLTTNGMPVAETTTAINGMLSELSTTGSKADKTLREKTGKSFKELNEEGMDLSQILGIIQESASESGLQLHDMFGNIRARSAVDSLMGGGPKQYQEFLKEMQNSDGSVDKNYEKMMGDELAHAKAVEQLRNAFIDMGAAVTPVLTTIMEGIGNLAMKFQNLSPESQKMISIFALIAVAAGPLIMILGGVVASIGAIATGIGALTAPILAGVAIFAVLIAAGVALATHWGTIKAKAAELGGAIKGKLQGAANAVSGAFQSMKSKVTGALQTIKQKWESVKSFFAKPIKGVISVAGGIWNKIKGGGGGKVPSHASGLDSVPYDDYNANLHKDEMVLTARASRQFRALGGTKDGLPSLSRRGQGDTYNTTKNSGGNTYSPTIVINYSGKDKDEARGIGNAVRRELEAFFKELQLQGV